MTHVANLAEFPKVHNQEVANGAGMATIAAPPATLALADLPRATPLNGSD